MLRQAPYDKIGQTPTPKYTNANPTSGDPGSIPNAETFNQLQYEAENLVALGGLTADGGNLFQSAQAASRGGIWVDTLTGTGDLAVATLPIAPSGAILPALLKGMRISGVTSAANTTTTPKLRVMNVGAAVGLYVDYPILKTDGSTPAVGEIKSGRFVDYKADGAGNVLISGGGISSTSSAAATASGAPVILTGTGSGSIQVPSWATAAVVEVWGPGGGSGGSPGSSNGGAGGGGGGGYAIKTLTGLTPGASINYVLGTPGSGGAAGGGYGTGGSATSFGSYLSASGGGGGGYGSTAAGGTAGSGSGGDINLSASPGGQSIGTVTTGGQGGGSPFGGSGGTPGGGTAGGVGTVPGGGAGGGGSQTTAAGTTGGNGAIRIFWRAA